jgi:RNA polymerase sigma factor (sigma-70 family)
MRSSRSEHTDAGLIGASVAEPRAFAQLFDRHARAIWRYACRRAGPVVADETVSETFLRAFAQRAGYDGARLDARPWLYGIATNVLREQARDQARRRGEIDPNAPADDELDRAEARADSAARVPATVAALARLEPVDREALLLYALTDLQYDQIATAMDVPVGTVRSRLHRARRRLRAELGLAQTGAAPDSGNEGSGP